MLDALRLARAGYIVVIQDVRGRFTSDGAWAPYRHDGSDGYDSVEWTAGLPGSNGNVGMFGASYYGFTQWVTAVEQPPHLKALVPFITWAGSRDGGTWRGGAFELGKVAYWQVATIAFDVLRRRYKDAPRAELGAALSALVREIDTLGAEGYRSLPLKDFAPFQRLGIAPELAELVARPYDREYNAPTRSPRRTTACTSPLITSAAGTTSSPEARCATTRSCGEMARRARRGRRGC